MNSAASMKRIIYAQAIMFCAILLLAYWNILAKRKDFGVFLVTFLQSRLLEANRREKGI